ncbi:MAG: hypothetical protein FWH36_02755 [Lentimicrobiaceae bacterium]|nr:hypothetical protein [Lentimicrobiaceae bacterium]
MKTTKIISVLLLSTVVLFSGCGLKKMVKKQSEVAYSVTPNPLETHGGKMTMEIKGNYPAKYFHKKANVTITPVIKAEDGTTLKLKPIAVKGENAVGEGQSINYKTGGSFSSSQTVDYNPAFVSCVLVGEATATMGSKNATFEEIRLGEGTIATSELVSTKPELAYQKDAANGTFLIFANHGYTGKQIATGTAMIYYEWNMDNLNMNLPLNKKAENKEALADLFTFMEKYPVVENIQITGWASPEGELTRNQELSGNRSKTAKSWFDREYNNFITKKAKGLKVKPAELKQEFKFDLEDKGEDWDGFLSAVSASSIKDKDQVLNVIRSQADHAQRQQQIRNMIAIYNEIDKDILPNLRRAIIKINCTDSKSDEQIAQLAATNPEELSLVEILYSASLTNDLKTKTSIYETIIKLFPEDYRAYNDLACIKASQGEKEEVAKLLEKAGSLSPNNGVIQNNVGVIALMNKDYEAAQTAFDASQKAGVSQSYNLGVIDLKNGDYTAASSKMSGSKCAYNLALQQLLSKNYPAAKSTIDCITNKGGEEYYLAAVIAARMNDANGVYSNLKQACEANTAYKVQAKKDMEFKAFRTKPEFDAAIK